MLSREEQIVRELLLRRRLLAPADLDSFERSRAEGADLATSIGRISEVSPGRLVELQEEARALAAIQSIEIAPGSQLGEFRIVREIGRGGMGMVFEAVQEPLGRRVALKVLPVGLALSQQQAVRFLREARVTSQLDHPGIARVYTCGQTEQAFYFAMELIDGHDLTHRKRWDPLEAAEILLQVALALSHAHAHGLIHRDVKPANILIDSKGHSRLVDFGLVQDAGAATITHAYTVVGTPAFMAPEQAEGGRVDVRSDVYSTGAVLYAMLSGRPPYSGDTPAQTLVQLLTSTPAPLAKLAPDTPSGLIEIVERAMARSPTDRFSSADDMAKALKEFLHSPRRQRPVSPRYSRLRFPAALAAVAIAITAALAVWSRHEVRGPVASTHIRSRVFDLGHTFVSFGLSPQGDLLRATGPMMDPHDIVMSHDLATGLKTRESAGCVGSDALGLTGDGRSIKCLSDEAVELVDFATGAKRSFALSTPNGRLQPRHFVSPDGTKWLIDDGSRLWLGDETGAPRMLLGLAVTSPCWSPQLTRFAFITRRGGRTDLWTMSTDGGEPVRVSDNDAIEFSPVWVDSGHLYYGVDDGLRISLYRIALSEDTGQASSAPERVLELSFVSPFVVTGSPSGQHLALAHAGQGRTERAFHMPIDVRRAVLATDAEPVASTHATRVAVPDRSGRLVLELAGTSHLSVVDADGQRVLSREPYLDQNPRWSPDGAWIAFQSNRSGHREIWTVRPDGRELARRTRIDSGHASSPVWSPDGGQIAFTVEGVGAGMVAASGIEQTPELLPPMTDGQLFEPHHWSSDGFQLAGSSAGIVMLSLRTGQYRRLTHTGTSPVWLPDDRRLLYIANDEIRLVDSQSTEDKSVVAFQLYTPQPPLHLSPDGTDLYFTLTVDPQRVMILNLDVASNGFPEKERSR